MSSRLITTIREVRDELAARRRAGQSIGLVPTMGALHAGHQRLIEVARSETGCLVVSIFVNPIQFNQAEDFEKYPRPMEDDLTCCDWLGADIVFAPTPEEMYPQPLATYVEVGGLGDHLCGKFRPGHFRGVATVVTKLFEILQPDRAYFGEKDAQQLAIIHRMVQDLNIPVEVIDVPTVRESDGLALSSRNLRLVPERRADAPALYAALCDAARRVQEGETRARDIQAHAIAQLGAHPGIRVEYFELVDPATMQPVETIGAPVRIALAAWLGDVRLIDNVLAVPPIRRSTSS